MDGERVHHHAGLEFLDAADLGGLLGGVEVLVDDAHAAVLGHGDGHRGLGDGVHRRGDQRDVERDGAGEPGAGVGGGGQHLGIGGHQQHVVEGERLVDARVGSARWWAGIGERIRAGRRRHEPAPLPRPWRPARAEEHGRLASSTEACVSEAGASAAKPCAAAVSLAPGSRSRPRRARSISLRLAGGLAWRTVAKRALQRRPASARSEPPWNTLATKPPPGASTSSAKSSASLGQRHDAQMVGRGVPGGVGRHVGQHEVGLAAQQRRSRPACRIGEVALQEVGAGDRIDRQQVDADHRAGARAAPPPGSSRPARRPGRPRGRRGGSGWKRSSSSISLNAARERQPCCLAAAHIGSLSWRAASAARRGAAARGAQRARPAPRGGGCRSPSGPAVMRRAASRPAWRRRAARRGRRGSCAAACPRAGRDRRPRTSAPARSRVMAANTAQPGSTKSTRSGPTQGCCTSPSRPSARRLASACDAASLVEHGAVHQRAAVAREIERHAGQRGDGAAGAQQPDAAVADFVGDAVDRLERRQPRGHVVDHRLEPVVR